MKVSNIFWGLTILLANAFMMASCGKDTPGTQKNEADNEAQRFELLDPKATGVDFANEVHEDFQMNIITNSYLYNGGGVGVIDVNNDGLQDLFFTSSQGSCKLYMNEGSLKFKDITDKAGVAAKTGIKTGVTIVDINGDGFQDIYICRTGLTPTEDRRNLLFINNKNSTFTEQAKAYGLDDMSASNHANFFDYDNDGDLDMYLLNHPVDFSLVNSVRVSVVNGKYVRDTLPKTPYDSDRLYRNNGNGTFTDVTAQAGLINKAWGLSVTVSDFNHDGYPDLYIANDYIEPDMVYINNRNGTFTNRMRSYFRHISNHTMGVDVADFNNDGLVDVIGLDMLAEENYRRKSLMTTMLQDRYLNLTTYGYYDQMMRNVLQLNNGNGTFSEIGCLAGVYNTDWSWAPLMLDFNNDGLKDLYITNGYRKDVTNLDYLIYTTDSINKSGGITPKRFPTFDDFLKMVPSTKLNKYMFKNKGDLTFMNVENSWMGDHPAYSNGAAYADLDNDGDMDLIVNNLSDPAFVFKNKTNEIKDGNYLQIKLKGPAKNLFGTGAKVTLHTGNTIQYEEMTPNHGFFSSVEPILHFGLAKIAKVDRVDVVWPDGKIQSLDNVNANQRLTLKYEDAKKGTLPGATAATAIFKEVNDLGVAYVHKENDFIDFNRERLIPHKLSNTGPSIATGDVNGDGLMDFYVGGAFGSVGALFVQGKDSRFTRSSVSTFAADTLYEDTGCLFFDADGDKDLDLYVVSGGNEFAANADPYQDRLYINDGKGNFAKSAFALPRETDSGSAVAAFDYDGDGDLDLFVAGRSMPGLYPTTPRSFVLQNNQGKFMDVTDQVSPDFKQIGMVTSMAFADIDGDKKAELILAGEWMPITILRNKGGVYKNETSDAGLENSNGWWDCFTVADVDKDGDLDIVAGNLGWNSRLRATQDEPLRCYAKDFDNNGSIDPIITYYYKDVEYTLSTRDLMFKQIPSLKKKFVRYEDYAKATLTEIYQQSDWDSAQKLEAKTFTTSVFLNNGGKFTQQSLPVQAQTAPVKHILVQDFNGDGNPDLLMVGNDYGTEVESGKYDAFNGLLLLGDGKGGFAATLNRDNGFWAMLEARDLERIPLANGKEIFIVANNNDRLQFFEKQ